MDKKTGKTRLTTLQEIFEQTGVLAPELADRPDVPRETAHVWEWFSAISRRRLAGWSSEPVTWSDVWSYFDLHRIRPERWELAAIADLDDLFLGSRLDTKVGTAKGAKALKRSMTGKAAE